MRVALIKLSSMGDVIHTLPAITDAYKCISGIEFTWVIEPDFAEIATWHPAVTRVQLLHLRNMKFCKIMEELRKLRSIHYDCVLDAQGLIKSAVLAKLVSSNNIIGLSKLDCREKLASYFYKNKVNTGNISAINKLRKLFAGGLGYELPENPPDFGVAWNVVAPLNLNGNNKPYCIFLHGTTWKSKHWDPQHWLQLAHLAASYGMQIKVTWATPQQREFAEYLADRVSAVSVVAKMNLRQAATLIRNSVGCIAVDTGFSHLTAALRKPLVTLFGPTDFKLLALNSDKSINLQVDKNTTNLPCVPCGMRNCKLVDKDASAKCMQEILPEQVWQQFLHISSLFKIN